MAGEIIAAILRYEERREAAGMGAGKESSYEEMAIVWMGLDLDVDEMQTAKMGVGVSLTQNLMAGFGNPVQLGASVYLDGIVIGLLIAEARERERAEPNVEELDMIALALKNQGIEQVAPERGVEILIERLVGARR